MNLLEKAAKELALAAVLIKAVVLVAVLVVQILKVLLITQISNNEGNSGINKNNDQAINDGSNRGADNNLQAIGPAKTGEQQATGDNAPSIETVTPTRQTTCKEGSNCTTYQQVQSNSDHSTTTTTKEGNTPLVLSLPFP
jgi:hypothetical protein